MLLPEGPLKPENQEEFHKLLLELRDFLRSELEIPYCGYESNFRGRAMATRATKKLRRITNREHLIIGGKKND